MGVRTVYEERRIRGSDIMDKASYEYTRGLLVAQRKKIMDTLEEQEDFPDPKLVQAYYDNQTQIIDLDTKWEAICRK
jgi:hypothetical protein